MLSLLPPFRHCRWPFSQCSQQCHVHIFGTTLLAFLTSQLTLMLSCPFATEVRDDNTGATD